jgi:GNAT superfamily N-acetyltransferase
MPELRLKATGQMVDISASAVADALATGLYDPPDPGTSIPIQASLGDETVAAQVSHGALPLLERQYSARPQTEAEIRAAERAARIEREHGGALGAVGTFVEQGLDTATFGATGAITDTIWGDDYTADRRERLEANPEAGVAGTIAGVVAPAVLSGGTGAVGALARATPAGMASQIGARIAAGGGLARATAGYAVEGALYGAGHVLSESVLHDKELSAEAFLAGAKEGALWGGAAGAGMALLSAGGRAAKRGIEKVTEGRSELATLQAEQRAAMKEAEKAARLRDKIRLDQERTLNRAGLEELKQKGRLDVVAARGQAQTGVQEARLKIVDARAPAELAKAEAKAISARARADKASEALQVEQARLERARLVMDGRIQLSETYTAGWRRAADSREGVAASKLEAAELGADARMRTGFADALVKSGREDAGYLIEELIPAKLRTPAAEKAAKGELLNQTARVAAATDDLVRQADEMMSLNPALEPELRALRDRAAESSPTMRDWADKQAGARRFQEEHLDDLRSAGFTAPERAPAPTKMPTYESLPPGEADEWFVTRTVPIEELKPNLIAIEGVIPGRMENIRRGLDEGVKLDPVDISITPSGKLFVNDGRHRLRVAAERGDDVEVRFSRGSEGTEAGTDPLFPGDAPMFPQAGAGAAPGDDVIEIGGKQLRMETRTEAVGTTERLHVELKRTLGDGEEVVVGNAEFRLRDGELYPHNVQVQPNFQRQGLATRMYEKAEALTGKKIVPSRTQTPEGKALSESYAVRRAAPKGSPIQHGDVTQAERTAVMDYTGPEYASVNTYLRGAPEGTPLSDPSFTVSAEGRTIGETVEQLDALIGRSVVQDDMTVFRGVTDREGQLATLAPGSVLQDKAYLSTSISEDFARNWASKDHPGATLFRIEVPKGSKAAHASQIIGRPGAARTHEAEVLLPRNARIEVLDVTTTGGERNVRARLMPEPEPRPAMADAPSTEFQAGLETVRAAEQAQYDLAQAIRPYLDDVAGMSLDDAIKGMDDAIALQDDIVTGAALRQAEAKASLDDTLRTLDEESIAGAIGPAPGAPAPAPAAGRRRAGAGEGIAVLDLLAGVGGLPNANDIPVVGPLLSVYLKYRAVAGALGKLGIRVGGPVANIARTAASTQDRAAQAVQLLVRGAEKGAPVVRRSAAPLTSTLSRPLWDPVEDDAPAKAPARPATDRDVKPAKKDPQKLFEKRQEEILRATADPEATKREIAASVPAPPALANAIAEAMYRRFDFLLGVMPQDPRPPMLKPTPYQYPIAELRRFADALWAVTEPLSVLDDLMVGAVSPIAAKALREVFPRFYQQIQEELIEQVATSSKPIPYERKGNLALVFDVALDGTMTPEYRAARQQEYVMAAQAAPPAGGGGPQLKLSQQDELGPMRRAMR